MLFVSLFLHDYAPHYVAERFTSLDGSSRLERCKIAALKIQTHWREKFMTLDLEKLTAANPLLQGDDQISICDAAKAIGLSDNSLLNELLNERALVFTYAQDWPGWHVEDLDLIDKHPEDGGYRSCSGYFSELTRDQTYYRYAVTPVSVSQDHHEMVRPGTRPATSKFPSKSATPRWRPTLSKTSRWAAMP